MEYRLLDPEYRSARRGPRLRFRHLAAATVSLPLFGFLFCVAWSLLYNFESATSTHCEVANYLPSLSAAIGSFRLQRRVWKTLIALQALPRLLVGYLYRLYWEEALLPSPTSQLLLTLSQLLYAGENLGLLGLSFVTSADNFPFHKTMFIVFLSCSELYMLVSCVLSRQPRARPPDRLELVSRRHRVICFMLNVISLMFALYFYKRHNDRCEPGVYTLFAFCEYVVVLSNMAFHMTAYWDFHDRVLDLSTFSWS